MITLSYLQYKSSDLWKADLEYTYLPIILGLIGFGLSKLIRLIISKFKYLNPPIVIQK